MNAAQKLLTVLKPSNLRLPMSTPINVANGLVFALGRSGSNWVNSVDSMVAAANVNNVGEGAALAPNLPASADITRTSSQYICWNDSAALSVGDQDFFGIVWTKLKSKASNQALMSHWLSTGNQRGWTLDYFSTDRFVFGISPDGTNTVTVTANYFGSPALATPYMTFFYHDSVANKIGVSVNNYIVDTLAHSTGAHDSTGSFAIGAVANPTDYSDANINGYFWKRLLPPLEYWWLYNNQAGRSYAEIVAGIPAHHTRILCEGDSITLGYNATVGQSYPHQLQSALGTNYLVLSSGVSGKRISEAVYTNTAEANASRIDTIYQSGIRNVLVVWLGTNDLAFTDDAATAYSQLVSYCQARKTAHTTQKIVVCTCLPRTDVDIAAKRATYNASIRSNYATFADAVADVAEDSTLNNASNFPDGIHPDATQLGIAAGIIQTAIQSLSW